jgi:hypothetical protein
MTACPPPADLQGLLTDRVPADKEGPLLAHVESCPACQQALEELTAACSSRLWGQRTDVVAHEEPSLHKPSFLRALEAAPPSWPLTLSPGEADGALPATLGRYEVREEIGRGGMGWVLRGHDPDLGRDLAIKVLRLDQQHDPTSGRVWKRRTRESRLVARAGGATGSPNGFDRTAAPSPCQTKSPPLDRPHRRGTISGPGAAETLALG